MSLGSVNNAGHVGPTAQTHGAQGAAPATLGPFTVTTGALPSGPPATGGFGERAKAFFQDLGGKFASLRDAAASLPGLVGAKVDAWRGITAQSRAARNDIDGWRGAPADLESNQTTKASQASNNNHAVKHLGSAQAAFGAPGTHAMAERMLGAFKREAAGNLGQTDKPQTWQECARESFKSELMKAPTYADAGQKVDGLAAHFAVYAEAGNRRDLAEMGQILAGLRSSVAQAGAIEQQARAGFSAEINGEMRQLNNFFRGETEAVVNTSTFMRNACGPQTARLVQTFGAILADPQNKAEVDLANAVFANKPTTQQQQAINSLSQKFLDQAFNLRGDGGAAFAQQFDPTARQFLSDTSTEISNKATISANDRNDGIRKWFSNGMGLRDFGSESAKAVSTTDQRTAGIQVGTNILRIFGDVGANSATRSKIGDDAANAYGAFHAQVGPQFTAFLGRMGMPTAV